jgi:hypothetical protein
MNAEKVQKREQQFRYPRKMLDPAEAPNSNVITRNLIRAVNHFRDAVLMDKKKGDFENAL